MVELKDLTFKIKNKNSEIYNRVFDRGVNHLEYSDKDLFNFLTINKQELVSGALLVDGINNFSSDSTNSFYILKINSFCVSLFAIFSLENTNKKALVEEINNCIIPLKDIADAKQKLTALFNILLEKNVSYICLDSTEDTNFEYSLLLNDLLKLYPTLTVIVLDENHDEGSYYSIDLSSNPTSKQEEPTKAHAKKTNKDIKKEENHKSFLNFRVFNDKQKPSFFKFLIDNISLFLFLILPITAFIGPFILCPTYFVDQNVGLGITFLLTGLFCLIIHLINMCDVYDFLDHKDTLIKEKHKFTYFASLISTILGIGGGIGFFFLIKNISPLKHPESFNLIITLLPVTLIVIVVLLCPLYINYLRKFINRIKSLFNKR